MASNEIEEQHKLGLMRSIVEKQDPTSKEVDDLILKRFLRVRKMDVHKACESFLKCIKWRRMLVPTGSISESEIANELAQKKVFLQGYDKKMRPIVVVFYGRTIPPKGKESLEEFKRFLIYSLDKICARMPNGQEQFCAIGDLQGWGYSNWDISSCLAFLSIVQDNFPERLGQQFLLHEPYIFKTAWKFISPFLSPNTKKKVIFVDKKKVTSRLLQDIDENQLPNIYGGKLPLVSIEDS